MPKLLSVIIPTNNRQGNLQLTLAALLQQTLEKDKFEVIISDDRSMDVSHNMINWLHEQNQNRIGKELKFRYVYNTVNTGWNASIPRNLGALVSSRESDWFVFVDSDVLLEPKALEYYWDNLDMNSDPLRVIIGIYHWLRPMNLTPENVWGSFKEITQNKINPYFPKPGEELGHVGEDIRMVSFKKAKSPLDTFKDHLDSLACFGGNLAISKKLFWKIGGYDENIMKGCEDGDMGLSCWEAGARFSFDKRIVGWHVWHPIPRNRQFDEYGSIRTEIKKLDEKHGMDIVKETHRVFRKWGLKGWTPPESWVDPREWPKIKKEIEEEDAKEESETKYEKRKETD